MSNRDNKRQIAAIFEQLAKGEGDAFVEAMSEDFCWSILGTSKWSGTYEGKRAVLSELLDPLFAQFADLYTLVAERILAEDDYVVVQCRGQVTTKSGIPYNNAYCYVIRMDNGMMAELTEYADTALFDAALEPPPGRVTTRRDSMPRVDTLS